MDPNTAVSILIIIFLASFVQGITGFGYAVISAPLIVGLLPKETMVTLYAILSVVLNGFLFSAIRAKVAFRKLIPFIAGSIAGLPFGIMLLKIIDQNTLVRAVGLLSVLSIPYIVFKKQFRLPKGTLSAITGGVFAGILQTSATINGPLVVSYFANTENRQEVIRRSLAGFFFILAVVSLYLLAFSRTATPTGVLYGLLGIPATVLGAYAGNFLAGKISVDLIKTVTVGIVILSGINALFK